MVRASLSSLPPPSKKRKTRSDEDNASEEAAQLEARLTEALAAGSSLNALADLLDIVHNTNQPPSLSKAIYALYRIFVLIINNGMLVHRRSAEVDAVREWIQDKLRSYVDFLAGLLHDEEPVLRTSTLQILFSLQRHLSVALNKHSLNDVPSPQFHIMHFKKIVYGLLVCPSSPRASPPAKKRSTDYQGDQHNKLDSEVTDIFVKTWLNEYDDVRWFFLREAAAFITSNSHKSHPQVAENLLSILERMNTFPTDPSELNKWWVEEFSVKPPKPKTRNLNEEDDDPVDNHSDAGAEDDWRTFFDEPTPQTTKQATLAPRLDTLTIHQSLHSLASHKAVFSRAWLALLPLLSSDTYQFRKPLSIRALNVMYRGVMPHLTRPIMIMDWIGSCVDYGGAVGLLALNALFILMKDYNLDYPSFYTRLYGFLDRDLLHLKHRTRFFRLTELFLSSTHLPATLLASFMKRLSRLSLNASPSAIVMIIPFTYNILKTHPALMVMIHRIEDSHSPQTDTFLNTESNPVLTNAIDSSLWELYSHKNHYHPTVSTLARIFEEAFTKPSYAMEDFHDHTYSTMFDNEAKRNHRKEPVVMPEISQSFTTGLDIMGDLWIC